jgi:hypothetical protein
MLYESEHAPISRSDWLHGSTPGDASPSGTGLSPKEGDAFLVRVRVWDVALLM